MVTEVMASPSSSPAHAHAHHAARQLSRGESCSMMSVSTTATGRVRALRSEVDTLKEQVKLLSDLLTEKVGPVIPEAREEEHEEHEKQVEEDARAGRKEESEEQQREETPNDDSEDKVMTHKRTMNLTFVKKSWRAVTTTVSTKNVNDDNNTTISVSTNNLMTSYTTTTNNFIEQMNVQMQINISIYIKYLCINFPT